MLFPLQHSIHDISINKVHTQSRNELALKFLLFFSSLHTSSQIMVTSSQLRPSPIYSIFSIRNPPLNLPAVHLFSRTHTKAFVKAEVSYNIHTQSAEEHCTYSKKAVENLRKSLSAAAFHYEPESAQIKSEITDNLYRYQFTSSRSRVLYKICIHFT